MYKGKQEKRNSLKAKQNQGLWDRKVLSQAFAKQNGHRVLGKGSLHTTSQLGSEGSRPNARVKYI